MANPKDLFNYMLNNKINRLILDPWDNNSTTLYLNDLVASKKIGEVKYKKNVFYIDYKPGGGVGMGEYPSTYTIFCLKRFKK